MRPQILIGSIDADSYLLVIHIPESGISGHPSFWGSGRSSISQARTMSEPSFVDREKSGLLQPV